MREEDDWKSWPIRRHGRIHDGMRLDQSEIVEERLREPGERRIRNFEQRWMRRDASQGAAGVVGSGIPHLHDEIAIPGATALTGVAAAGSRQLFVSDAGVDAAGQPTGTDAIWRVHWPCPSSSGSLANLHELVPIVEPLVRGTELGQPRGLVAHKNSVYYVSWRDGTFWLVDPRGALTQSAYNLGAFAPTAEDVRTEVVRAFPSAKITFDVDAKRQGIVDSWPEDVDDSAARRDWRFAPRFDFMSAFRDYLIPAIRQRYGSR